MRRDGRVAEGARLESVYTLTGIGGSNPSLSASILNTILKLLPSILDEVTVVRLTSALASVYL